MSEKEFLQDARNKVIFSFDGEYRNPYFPAVSNEDFFACKKKVREILKLNHAPEYALEEALGEYDDVKMSGTQYEKVLSYLVVTEMMAYMLDPEYSSHETRVALIRALF